VARLLKHFRTIKLSLINQTAIDKSCEKPLRPGTGPSGQLSAVIAPMNAIMEHAALRDMCPRPRFEKPKVPAPTTPYLYPDQATNLVRAVPLHLRSPVVFLLGIGCRPSEALALDWKIVDLRGGQATLYLGKVRGKELVVTPPPVVIRALTALPHRNGPVFRTWLPGESGHPRLGPAYRGAGHFGAPGPRRARARNFPGRGRNAWTRMVTKARISPR
jgi:integrase